MKGALTLCPPGLAGPGPAAVKLQLSDGLDDGLGCLVVIIPGGDPGTCGLVVNDDALRTCGPVGSGDDLNTCGTGANLGAIK